MSDDSRVARPSYSCSPFRQQERSCPKRLPDTITLGMPVVEIDNGMPGTVVGITQAYCIYRIIESQALVVAPWRDIALGHVCPIDALLPADVTKKDRRNAQAAVLRELLHLEQFGLTTVQTTLLEELTATLADA